MCELVSIIVPVYNVEQYLKRCVDSLISQTYENIEIFLVDDGSEDRSGDMCDEYRKSDSRIKVIHQENKGISAARNAALKLAQGRYVCFADSDDYVPDDYIGHLYELLSSNNADAAVGNFTKFYEESVGDDYKNAQAEEKITVCNNVEMIKKMHTVAGESFVVIWGKLFKRELFTDIEFPEGRICEDHAVLYKIYDRITKAVVTDKVSYFYFRNNTGSATHELNMKFYKDVFKTFEEEIEYLSEKHPELVKYLKKKYLYWLLDLYRNLYFRKDTEHLKKIHGKYKEIYVDIRKLPKEKFYTFFYYFPKLYLEYKKK